jgi:hypothetical protein
MFTYDSAAYPGMVCKTPSAFSRELDKGIEANGDSTVSLDEALRYFPIIIKESTKNRKITPDWKHYVILVTTEDSQSPDKGLKEFQEFLKELNGDVDFTVISQATRTYRLGKLANTLNGGLYTVKVGSNMNQAFVEALIKEKKK